MIQGTKYYCMHCRKFWVVAKAIVKAQRDAGLIEQCPKCGGIAALPERVGITDNQKRSRQQEKRAAKRVGGRVQPASGAGRSKGDVRVPGELRMECKLTRANSYSLRLDLLEKIEKECEGGERPVFEIEFQGVHPPKRYVVLPGWLYDHFSNLQEVTRAL